MWFGTKSRICRRPLSLKRGHHPVEGRLVAEFRIQRVVIHDVVPVRASRPRLQPWRSINVADAQTRQIGRELRGFVETEALWNCRR